MRPVPALGASEEEMEEFGAQSPEVRVRAILAAVHKRLGRAPSHREIRAWAKDQRALADAADVIAEELGERRLRDVNAKIAALTAKPVSVLDYLERAREKT